MYINEGLGFSEGFADIEVRSGTPESSEGGSICLLVRIQTRFLPSIPGPGLVGLQAK